MGIYREVGKRIRERLLARGYVKSDGELDVERFSWDFRFGRTNLYNWIGDRAVPFKHLLRLCTALDCSVEWLLTGIERDPKAKPRRHRGKLGSLLLALSVGGGLALWPSGRVSAELVRYDSTPSLSPSTLSEVRRRRSLLSFGLQAA